MEGDDHSIFSLLAREINWLETEVITGEIVNAVGEVTPYSLGKLIDWKLRYCCSEAATAYDAPYSLGKLIDWKLPTK
jgi:hypothetical protein